MYSEFVVRYERNIFVLTYAKFPVYMFKYVILQFMAERPNSGFHTSH